MFRRELASFQEGSKRVSLVSTPSGRVIKVPANKQKTKHVVFPAQEHAYVPVADPRSLAQGGVAQGRRRLELRLGHLRVLEDVAARGQGVGRSPELEEGRLRVGAERGEGEALRGLLHGGHRALHVHRDRPRSDPPPRPTAPLPTYGHNHDKRKVPVCDEGSLST